MTAETLKWFWALLKTDVGSLGVAGVAGAIAVSMVEWSGWVQLARKVVVGGICAVYLAPLAVPLLSFFLNGLSVTESHAPTLGGFVMGMFGIVFVEFILHIIRARQKYNKTGTFVVPPEHVPPVSPPMLPPSATDEALSPPPPPRDPEI